MRRKNEKNVMILKRIIRKTAALVLTAVLLSGCGAETKLQESSKQLEKNEVAESANEKVDERRQQGKVFQKLLKNYESQGVKYAKLIDFDGNGIYELLVAYESPVEKVVAEGATYRVEIWSYDDGKAIKIYSSNGVIGGVSDTFIGLAEENDFVYICEGIADGAVEELKWYQYDGKDFSVIKEYSLSWGEDDQPVYQMDGQELTFEQYGEEIDKWKESTAVQGFYLNQFDGTRQRELAHTKELLEQMSAGEFNSDAEFLKEISSVPEQQPYDEVLQQFYRDIVNQNFSLEDGSQYFRVDSLDEFGYAFIDLNNDGIDELFLGSIDNLREHNFFKMYILEDGKAKELLSTGTWYSYSLCEDGYIAEYESSMATKYYQLEDGLVEKEFYDTPFNRKHPPLSMEYTPFRNLEL